MMNKMGGIWKDYKVIPGVTRHALAQITELDLPCIDNNTRVRTPDVTFTWRDEERPSPHRARKLCLEGKVEVYLIYLRLTNKTVFILSYLY